jgi:hypothetical protein
MTFRGNLPVVGMTYLFFRLLNGAEKECEFIKQGLHEVLATIIRIEVVGVCIEECINDSKCGRAESAVPFAYTLICLGCATSCKPAGTLI